MAAVVCIMTYHLVVRRGFSFSIISGIICFFWNFCWLTWSSVFFSESIYFGSHRYEEDWKRWRQELLQKREEIKKKKLEKLQEEANKNVDPATNKSAQSPANVGTTATSKEPSSSWQQDQVFIIIYSFSEPANARKPYHVLHDFSC